MNRLVATGLYPVVELGPSFQQYSSDVNSQLSDLNAGLEAFYALIDDMRINIFNPMYAYTEQIYNRMQENTDPLLNAFRTLPLAPVGKLGGQSALTAEGFEQCLPEEHVDSDEESDGDQDFIDVMCACSL